MREGNSIVVIGGGILGLTAAWDLSRRGFRVTVLEREASAGGLAAPLTLAGGARLEKFYHHFFAGQRHLLDLLRELELQDRLTWARTRMGFLCNGRIHPFGGPLDVLRFSPLPFAGRLRFGLGTLLLAHGPFGRDGRPALDWLRSICGLRATRLIWEPLLKMKFGSAFDAVSIGWLRNRVRDRQRGRSGGHEKLGYLDGSIGVVLDKLTKAVVAAGGNVRVGCPAEGLEVEGERVRAVRAAGVDIETDAVLATLANPAFCRLAAELGAETLAPLRAVGYQGALCAIAVSKRPLTDYYWINVVDPEVPFVVAVEHTNFIAPEVYGGHVIYLGTYLERGAPEWSMSDREINESFLGGLGRLSPRFRIEDLIEVRVSRNPMAQPVFGKSYRRPDMTTALANLFVANTSMLFPESRTVDSSIGLARKAAGLVASALGNGS